MASTKFIAKNGLDANSIIISNVASGTAGTDAINKGQLDTKQPIDGTLTSLSSSPLTFPYMTTFSSIESDRGISVSAPTSVYNMSNFHISGTGFKTITTGLGVASAVISDPIISSLAITWAGTASPTTELLPTDAPTAWVHNAISHHGNMGINPYSGSNYESGASWYKFTSITTGNSPRALGYSKQACTFGLNSGSDTGYVGFAYGTYYDGISWKSNSANAITPGIAYLDYTGSLFVSNFVNNGLDTAVTGGRNALVLDKLGNMNLNHTTLASRFKNEITNNQPWRAISFGQQSFIGGFTNAASTGSDAGMGNGIYFDSSDQWLRNSTTIYPSLLSVTGSNGGLSFSTAGLGTVGSAPVMIDRFFVDINGVTKCAATNTLIEADDDSVIPTRGYDKIYGSRKGQLSVAENGTLTLNCLNNASMYINTTLTVARTVTITNPVVGCEYELYFRTGTTATFTVTLASTGVTFYPSGGTAANAVITGVINVYRKVMIRFVSATVAYIDYK